MVATEFPLDIFADLNGGEIAWRVGANAVLALLFVTVLIGRRVLGAFGSTLMVAGGLLGWATVQVAVEGGNRSGVVLLGVSSVALVATSMLGVRAGIRELERIPATAGASMPVGDDVNPSAWPAVLGLGSAVVVLGIAVHPALVVVGLAVVVLALAGWFGANWSQSSLAQRDVADAMSQRVTLPLGVPIGSLVLLLFVAVAVSRPLLAVTKNGAIAVGGAVAVAILGGCTLVALAPTRSQWLTRSMVVLAIVSIGAVGAYGTSQGEREFKVYGGGVTEVTVRAQAEGLAFDANRIVLPVDAEGNSLEARLVLVNKSAVAHHNISIYSRDPAVDADNDGNPDGAMAVFNGSWAAPLATQKYILNPVDAEGNPVDVAAASAGFVDPGDAPFYFQCDIHQNMRGTVEFAKVRSDSHGTESEDK